MKRKKRFRGRRFILIFLSLVASTLIFLNFFSARLAATILNIAKTETTNLTNYIINQAIQTEINSQEEAIFIETTVSDNGYIASLSFNTILINKWISSFNNKAQNLLAKISSGNFTKDELFGYNVNVNDWQLSQGIIYQIPIGLALRNSFLSEVGPSMPVRFRLIGEVITSAHSKITNYGINNVLIEVVCRITIRSLVMIPYVNDYTTITNDIPLATKVIHGEVPLYYQGNHELGDGGVSIPLQ